MTRLMNELINDEAVYRTAPATPGLLKTTGVQQCHSNMLTLDDQVEAIKVGVFQEYWILR